MAEIKIEISGDKLDVGSLVGPVLAIIASFLSWRSVQILGATRNMTALDIDVGILYFLLALGAVGIVWKVKPESKAKWLLAVGSLMVVFSVASLLDTSYRLSMIQSKLKGNPFGALAGIDIGIGVIIAIVAAIIIIYNGYKLSSPDPSLQLPKTGARRILMVLNGLLGLWTLLLLSASIFMPDQPDATRGMLFVASLIMVVTFFFSLYSMLKLKDRNKIVYSAFAGIVAVLIILLGSFTEVAEPGIVFENSLVFGILPLLVYIANLWYAKQE